MHLTNCFNDIAVIARPKLNGLGEHWGVRLPNGAVAHNTAEKGEHIVPFDDFARGKPVHEVRVVPRHRAQLTMWQIMHALSHPTGYDPLKNNCETFANRVTGEPAVSRQVNGWLVIAAIGLCCLAFE